MDVVLYMDEMRNVLANRCSFFHNINTSTYEDIGFEDLDDWNTNQDLCKNMCFSYIKAFQWIVKMYVVKKHQTYKVIHSLAKIEEYHCPKYKNGYMWKVSVTLQLKECDRHNKWAKPHSRQPKT